MSLSAEVYAHLARSLASFADDIVLPRMLHCKLLRARLPHLAGWTARAEGTVLEVRFSETALADLVVP